MDSKQKQVIIQEKNIVSLSEIQYLCFIGMFLDLPGKIADNDEIRIRVIFS